MRTFALVLIASLVSAELSAPAQAGIFFHRRPRVRVVPATPVRVVPVPVPVPVPVATTGGGDPYGFVVWLNGYRARYRLGPVVYDATLSASCAANNAAQQASGLGHYVLPRGYRCQNAAMTSAGVGSVESMWVQSPLHNANLLNPSITRVGIAGSGWYWTMDGM